MNARNDPLAGGRSVGICTADRVGSWPAASVLAVRCIGSISMLAPGLTFPVRLGCWSVGLFRKGGWVYFWYHTSYRSCLSLQEVDLHPALLLFTALALFPIFISLGIFWLSRRSGRPLLRPSALCGA